MKPISKWNNDGRSVLPSHDSINPGPEGTAYDLNRHECMRLRNVRYGFFRVATEPVRQLICKKCTLSINAAALIIDGVAYHQECFVNAKN